MLYRAEALELLARLVDEARENGELPKQGRPEKTAEPRRFSAPDHRRVAEGRLIARTGAVAKVEAALAEHDGNPADVPVITHATILRAATDPDASPWERQGKAGGAGEGNYPPRGPDGLLRALSGPGRPGSLAAPWG